MYGEAIGTFLALLMMLIVIPCTAQKVPTLCRGKHSTKTATYIIPDKRVIGK